MKGTQRYKCKECGYNYTVVQKSTVKSASERRFALMIYLEGLSFRSIGRLIGVSHSSVIKLEQKIRGTTK